MIYGLQQTRRRRVRVGKRVAVELIDDADPFGLGQVADTAAIRHHRLKVGLVRAVAALASGPNANVRRAQRHRRGQHRFEWTGFRVADAVVGAVGRHMQTGVCAHAGDGLRPRFIPVWDVDIPTPLDRGQTGLRHQGDYFFYRELAKGD